MPLEMNFSDNFGNDNANSYWELVKMNIDIKARVAVFNFQGYKNKASFQAGKQAVSNFEVLLTEAEFDALLPKLDQLVDQVETKSITKNFFKNAVKKAKNA